MAEAGEADFLLAPVILAFGHHLSALGNEFTAAGNRPVGGLKQVSGFTAERLGHRAPSQIAGGSTTISATDAYGQRLRR